MSEPREVFHDPENHWSLLTSRSDGEVEGQHFDRKEACHPNASGSVSDKDVRAFRQQVIECVSAFANSNVAGGLLVLGVSSGGQVMGLRHLTEDQRNSLTRFDDVLVNHGAQVKLHDCVSHEGAPGSMCVVYVPPARRASGETTGRTSN